MQHPESKAVNAYDTYGDFSLSRYFADKYNLVSSKLAIYLDVEEKKPIFDQAIALIELSKYQLSTVSKKWVISNNKNDDPDEDYVYFQVLGSDDYGICIEMELNNNELSVEFLYDQKVEGLELWIIHQIEKLRDKFGKSKSPVFRILARGRHGFGTEKVKLDVYDIDIASNYNDDFPKVNSEIKASIEGEESGLILLHGKPGTGKTSYIKSLVSQYVENKFIFIPNDFVNELLKPAFITFLIKQRNATLVIEDAEKIIRSRDHADQHSVVSTILQLTDGLFSDYLNVKIICTFNTDISKVDTALFRKGRMIAFYEFKELSIEKTLNLLEDKETVLKEGLTLAEIYNHNKNDYSEATTKKGIGFY